MDWKEGWQGDSILFFLGKILLVFKAKRFITAVMFSN